MRRYRVYMTDGSSHVIKANNRDDARILSDWIPVEKTVGRFIQYLNGKKCPTEYRMTYKYIQYLHD
jgi:hypothetical protein